METGTTELVNVKIGNGRSENGLADHLSLKSDGKTFVLSWDEFISDAWLVMVDECILRIDYKRDRNQWAECAFPNGYNHLPFLKLPAWDEKEVKTSDHCRTYTFQ